MKLYEFALAPNPRRVRMFLAEKGIEVAMVQVNTREREQFTDWYRAINPACTVPALELDDGTVITESVAICRYFEELQPEPALMGRDAKEKAIIEMWTRKAEFEGYAAAADALRNSLPMFEGRAIAGAPGGVPQIPELAERGRAAYARFLETIDARLGDSPYLAGDEFSNADITAFVTIDFAKRAELEVPESCANIVRWQAEIAARPSAEA